jgi:lia operon protein LiaG
MPHLFARIAGAALLLPAAVPAQQTERVVLDGRTVAIYNLVGTLKVEGGGGDQVVVEVTRVGRDAGRLKTETGEVRGRTTLRIRYPEDRIVYPQLAYMGRSTFSVNEDGTFGDGGDRGWSDRRRVEVRSGGDGLEAHADLHVLVPRGRTLYLRNGVGEATIDNVEGQVNVSTSSSRVRASRIRGSLSLESGSGGVEVSDVTGDVSIESGSGGATVEGVRGGTLHMDVGSGSLRGRTIDVTELVADVGSGGLRLGAVKTPKLHLETGSGGSDVELISAVDDVHIETGSGGVTLRIPSSTGAMFDIETGSGGIDTDFDVKVARVERRALHGTVGDGRGRIHIEAGSGTVRVIKS